MAIQPINYEDVFGTKPEIPELDEAQRQAILANLGNFGDLTTLGARTTAANQQQLLNQLMATDPLFQQRTALQGADIMAQLEGRLPTPALRYLQQVAAERSVGSGVQGSPFGFNAEMGLTRDAVLGQIQQGIQNANAFRTNLASTATVPGFDVSKGFITPEEQAQRDLLAANVAAAPTPAERGRYEENLAREFFNRSQAAGQPPQFPTGGGVRRQTQASAPDGVSVASGTLPPGQTVTPFDLYNQRRQQQSARQRGLESYSTLGLPLESSSAYRTNFPLMSQLGPSPLDFGGTSPGGVLNTYVPPYQQVIGNIGGAATGTLPSGSFSSPFIEPPPFTDTYGGLDFGFSTPYQAPSFDVPFTDTYSGLELGGSSSGLSSEDIFNGLLGIGPYD